MASDTAQEAIELEPARGCDGWLFRLRGVLVAGPCLAMLALGASLTPRRAGHGTHEKLGLPPCSFLSRTCYPCPSCGLTTSFAAMMHGQVVHAFESHPFGVVLVLAVAALGATGLLELLLGRDFLRFLRPGVWWAYVLFGGLLVGWGGKIAIGLARGTLPIH